MDGSRLTNGYNAGERRRSNGSMGSGRKVGQDVNGHGKENGHGEENGFVKRVLGGKRRKSRKMEDEALQPPRVEPEEQAFRPSDTDTYEYDYTPSGPAPLSPPLSARDEDTSEESDSNSDSGSDSDDETSADSEDGYDDPGLIASMGDLNRQVSISGQSFVEEPVSLNEGARSEQSRNGSVGTLQAMDGVDGPADSAPSTGHLPSSATFGGAERSSLDRIAAGVTNGSGSAYSAISHRSGPIRAGSIAASKARTAGATTTATATANNTLGASSGPILRMPSPTQRQVEMGLDSKEPPIPSAAEQAPIITGSIPPPQASANQAPAPVAGTVPQVPQGAGGSYFPQPANSQAGLYLDGLLHPSSASFMSTASAGSSSQQHAGPSSQASHRMERRNTSGSIQAPVMQSARTPVGGSFSWEQQPSLASLRRASQTEVPGLQGSALDPDILAEAEKLRRERLSKRQRKRSSGDDTVTILGGSPEPPFAISSEAGPSRGQTASPVAHGEVEDATRTSTQLQAAPVAGQQPVEGQVAVLNGGSAFVGNLIGEDHVNYVLMYNMLTGIRIGVSRVQSAFYKSAVMLIWWPLGVAVSSQDEATALSRRLYGQAQVFV